MQLFNMHDHASAAWVTFRSQFYSFSHKQKNSFTNDSSGFSSGTGLKEIP